MTHHSAGAARTERAPQPGRSPPRCLHRWPPSDSCTSLVPRLPPAGKRIPNLRSGNDSGDDPVSTRCPSSARGSPLPLTHFIVLTASAPRGDSRVQTATPGPRPRTPWGFLTHQRPRASCPVVLPRPRQAC